MPAGNKAPLADLHYKKHPLTTFATFIVEQTAKPF